MRNNLIVDFLIVVAVAVFLWRNERKTMGQNFVAKPARVLTPLAGSPDAMSDPFALGQSPFTSYAPPWAFSPPVDNFTQFDEGF